jgi:predicted DCC family thiol-disulfide oxidoreductase YuxK
MTVKLDKGADSTEIEATTLSAGNARNVILFDGVCNLCNGWVRFVVNRDPEGAFSFAPLQSNVAQALLAELTTPEDLDSIVLVEEDGVFVKSTAVLRIVSGLRQPWPLLGVLRLLPRGLRDFFYDVVARRRYNWFGRRDTCMIPTPEIRDRFLG